LVIPQPCVTFCSLPLPARSRFGYAQAGQKVTLPAAGRRQAGARRKPLKKSYK